MPGIKLVLTDMDGTIVETMKLEASEAVREAIIAAENQGVAVAAVTARPYEFAKSALTILGIEGLCVVDGGATIANLKTDEVVWRKWLDAETLKTVASMFLPKAVEIDYFPDDNRIAASDADVEAIDWEAPYVYASLPKNELEAMKRWLELVPNVACHVINLYDDELVGLQVTHAWADKSHGVKALCDILNIAKEHTLGIGDGDNDLPLFENAGLKVAMGNATENLKAKADHVVGTLEQDGFAEAMRTFVLR